MGVTFVIAQNKSNKGKEFWVGWGHNILPPGITTGTTSKLYLYLSAEQTSSITISIPGTTFTTITDIISAGQVKTYQITLLTIMLTTEGINTNKAIHVESDVPIVAYAHQNGANSAGATMLMPVETYGYTYYSLNYTQVSNQILSSTGNAAYSWCYVIASENNTRIKVTPSVLTEGGKAAGASYNIDLNKGEIYNFFGKYNGQSGSTYLGEDLTGSKVASIAGNDGNCHPVAVFSGSSRMLINSTNGGDVLQQQIFPASAWGTRYLTVPSSSATNVAAFNNNVYRIAVRNASTIVKLNGTVLTGLQNNFYYEFQSNTPQYIEADGPILVAQFFPSTSAAGYLGGTGDPEMIYLSPQEQAIKKAFFYNTTKEVISTNYLTVVIPNGGLTSLLVDGSNAFSYTAAHPQKAGYTIVIKSTGASNAQHTVQSDSSFTAFTYGLGSAESYGYNAGTLVNDLTSVQGVQNALTPVTVPSSATCKNTPFQLIASLTYEPTQMVWKLSQAAPALQPTNADTTVVNPVAFDTVTVNGLRYYRYKLPRTYYFNQTGSYNIPVTVTSPGIDNCSNSLDILITLTVGLNPVPDFAISYSGCQADTAYLSGSFTANGNNITSYLWDFDDNTTDNRLNTKKKFNVNGAHPVRFRVISDVGCIGDTTKDVNTIPPPLTTASPSPNSVCAGGTITFSPVSSFPGGAIDKWYFDFGDGTPVQQYTNSNPVPHTFTTAAHDDTVKHWILGVGGCKSETLKIPVRIWANPVADFTTAPIGCLEDSTAYFTDKSTVSDGQTLSWSWTFGDVNATPSNPNTSSLQNPTHRYKSINNYNVKLIATTVEGGCPASKTKVFNVPGFINPIVFSIVNENNLCSNIPVALVNGMDVVVNGITKFDIYWDTLNNPTAFDSYINPSNNQSFLHNYPVFTTPLTKDITIKLVVYSQNGCVSSRFKTITLNAKPDLYFDVLQGVCVNGSPKFVGNATLLNSVSGSGVYSGLGVLPDTTINPSITGSGYQQVKYKYTSTFGCRDSVSQTIYVFPKPVAQFVFNKNACLKDSVLFTDQSTITNNQTIKEWHWDFGNTSTSTLLNGQPFYNHYGTYGSFPATLFVVSDSACISNTTAAQTVTIYPDPIAAFLPPEGLCVPSGQAIFTNQSTMPSGQASQLSYSWNFGDNSPNSSAINPVHYYTTGIPPYTVTLTVTGPQSLGGCVVTNQQVLNKVFQDPTALFAVNKDTLCNGRSMLFEDKSTSSTDAITNWRWDFGNNDTTNVQNITKAFNVGTYTATLKVTTVKGCTSNPDYSETFTIYKQPVVDAGPNILIRASTPVMLMSTSNDTIFHYLWTPSIYLDDDTLLRPTSTPTFNTTYKLMAYGAGGNCVAYDTVKVTALQFLSIANAFSPNGDGINDVWEIPYLSDYPEAKVEIFNRAGQLVFHNVAYQKTWDGKFNGTALPVGTYYYIIEPKNNGY